MSAATTAKPTDPATAVRPPLLHLYCTECRSALAFCGRPHSSGRFPDSLSGTGGGQKCVVCTDLRFAACPHCGAPA